MKATATLAAGVLAMPTLGLAADLPSPTRPSTFLIPQGPAFNWTGFCVGATAGGAADRTHWFFPHFGASTSQAASSGLIGGRWLGFAEYDHYDFGANDVSLVRANTGAFRERLKVGQTEDIVKVGLNYRFGWGR